MSKKSFVMYSSWIPLFEGLDNEKAGELIKAICSYQNDPTVEPTDPVIGAIFSMIKAVMDEDRAKYEARCQKNAESVKARWDKDTDDSERIQTNTNVYERIKTNCDNDNDNDNDNENDNDNVKDSPTEKKKERGRRAPFTPPTVDEVADYCRERGNNVDPETFVDFYASKGWKVGNNPMKDWRASVRTWEKRDRAAPPRSSPGMDANEYLESIITGGGL